MLSAKYDYRQPPLFAQRQLFILGVSGAGKSFTAKEEMTNIILTDPNADVIIIDPEREYSPLVKAMQGEVIHISATSETISMLWI